MSSTKTFDLKLRIARLIKQYDYPMVLNVVMHRHNLDHIGKIIDMAIDMGVEYLELANTQYYGWGMVNRAHLLPTREQLEKAEAIVNEYRSRIGNKIKLLYVVPDYFEERPKACMNGWGSVFLAIAADGSALPCHAAKTLPGITFPNVKETSLTDIWRHSDAFNRYRGDDWMEEPCRSCDEKKKDFGGCRCQAYALTGNAANTDPVCSKSSQHADIRNIVLQARNRNDAGAAGSTEQAILFRSDANSRRFFTGKDN